MTTTDSSGYGATVPTDGTSESSTKDVAKEQATQVAGSAKEQAGQVASSATEKAGQVAQTTKEQAQEVVAEATAQARNLAGELKTQVDEQAGTQRDRLVGQLRSVSDELTQMAQGGGAPQGGIAGELVDQVNTRVQDLAGFLDGKEPSDILAAVQSYARSKPGTFLIGSAIAGLVAGRLSRGVRAATKDDSDSAQAWSSGYESTGYAATDYQANYGQSTYAATEPAYYAPEIPSSTYPTTVSSAEGFSTTGLDDAGTAYVDPYSTTDRDQGQRL